METFFAQRIGHQDRRRAHQEYEERCLSPFVGPTRYLDEVLGRTSPRGGSPGTIAMLRTKTPSGEEEAENLPFETRRIEEMPKLLLVSYPARLNFWARRSRRISTIDKSRSCPQACQVGLLVKIALLYGNVSRP